MKHLFAQEGHYFDIACLSGTNCVDDEKMKKFMYNANSRWANERPKLKLLEKSPNYFQTLWIPKLIHQYNDKAKIVIITCDPAARALSDYKHMKVVAEKAVKECRGRNLHLGHKL